MSLFWKIFVSFMIAMTITSVGAIYVTVQLVNQPLTLSDFEGRDRIIREMSAALARGGEFELKRWLFDNLRPAPGTVVLVTNERGDELLGRAMPRELRALLRFRPPNRRGDTPPNLRPMQLTPSLIGPDGAEYRLTFARAPLEMYGILIWPGTQVAVLSFAILTAAVLSALLARYVSSPIARLQKASRGLAAGALDTRVGAPFNRRRDEVGTLARDFDAMAERIQELVTAKETLLRDVSHEFRSPLARIRMALALAERRAGAESQPDLARIEREAERLDALVGQVMTLTRLRTTDAPRRDVVRLDQLVGEVVDDARFEYPDATLEYTPNAEVSLRGDGDGLKSAIENVVRNAMIYGDRTKPIEVRIDSTAAAATVRVLDRGPGVPEAELERIFEPFYRTDKSRDHRQDGQGIGLAITARVTELHGGKVRARNRPDGGLEIAIELPREGPDLSSAENRSVPR
ncbi:MAG TPA: ATP-binding protein [Gammaproteobacteria bacterium]|nr:ATP-binding protein [Gammaproteobacteria bacterium]